MNKQGHFTSVYPADPDTGALIVELSLPRYDDFFNHLDPSPLRKRDLAPDVKDYIADCSAEIPLTRELAFTIRITGEEANPDRERQLEQALRTFASLEQSLLLRRLAIRRRKAVTYFVIAVGLITAGVVLRNTVTIDFLAYPVFLQGIEIGAWVFAWEALSMLFIESADERDMTRRYERLERARVYFG